MASCCHIPRDIDVVGKLNYLTITRSNISFIVSVISQFMATPRVSHWEAIIRIVQYIKTDPGRGPLYKANRKLKVESFTDSNWAASKSNRRSILGYCTFSGSN